jgi:hypothetical protein
MHVGVQSALKIFVVVVQNAEDTVCMRNRARTRARHVTWAPPLPIVPFARQGNRAPVRGLRGSLRLDAIEGPKTGRKRGSPASKGRIFGDRPGFRGRRQRSAAPLSLPSCKPFPCRTIKKNKLLSLVNRCEATPSEQVQGTCSKVPINPPFQIR